MECSLCFEKYGEHSGKAVIPTILPCGHIFCRTCIISLTGPQTGLPLRNSCAICRARFIPKDTHVAYLPSTEYTTGNELETDAQPIITPAQSQEAERIYHEMKNVADDITVEKLLPLVKDIQRWEGGLRGVADIETQFALKRILLGLATVKNGLPAVFASESLRSSMEKMRKELKEEQEMGKQLNESLLAALKTRDSTKLELEKSESRNALIQSRLERLKKAKKDIPRRGRYVRSDDSKRMQEANAKIAELQAKVEAQAQQLASARIPPTNQVAPLKANSNNLFHPNIFGPSQPCTYNGPSYLAYRDSGSTPNAKPLPKTHPLYPWQFTPAVTPSMPSANTSTFGALPSLASRLTLGD